MPEQDKQPSLFEPSFTDEDYMRDQEEPQYVNGMPVEIDRFPQAVEPETLPETITLEGVEKVIKAEKVEAEEAVERYDNDADRGFGKRREEAKAQNGKPERAVPADKNGQTEQLPPKEKTQRGDMPIDRRGNASYQRTADGPPDHIRKQNRERGI
jgi:hypothetical protein